MLIRHAQPPHVESDSTEYAASSVEAGVSRRGDLLIAAPLSMRYAEEKV